MECTVRVSDTGTEMPSTSVVSEPPKADSSDGADIEVQASADRAGGRIAKWTRRRVLLRLASSRGGGISGRGRVAAARAAPRRL
jgi:hypothetical protein